MKKTSMLFAALCLVAGFAHSQTYDTIIWEVQKTNNLNTTAAQPYIDALRAEVDKILAAGHLAPLRMEQGDVKGQGLMLYWEPGRIITTLAMAYPYLTASQQTSQV